MCNNLPSSLKGLIIRSFWTSFLAVIQCICCYIEHLLNTSTLLSAGNLVMSNHWPGSGGGSYIKANRLYAHSQVGTGTTEKSKAEP